MHPEARPTSGGTPPTSENAPEKKKKTLRNALILGGAGIALAGTIVGIGLSNSASGEKPPVATESSAPVDSGSEEQPTESEVWYEALNLEPTANDIIIDASAVSPEELPAVYFNNRLLTWLNSGYSMDFAQGILEDENFELQAAEVAAQYDQLFINNLIASEHSSSVDNFLENMQQGHDDNILISAMTSFPDMNRYDEVPFMSGVELQDYENLTVAEDGSVTFTATVHKFYNIEQNTAAERDNIDATFEEATYTQVLTFVVEDGQYKLADMQTV